MSDAVAARRERVRVQRPTLVADEIGGGAVGWEDAGEAWVAVEARAAGRSEADHGPSAWARFSIEMARGPMPPRAGWRMLWRGRTLSVIGVLDDGGSSLSCLCEEAAP